MDSTGVHVLLEHQARAAQEGARLSIVACPLVERVLQLSGLRDQFERAPEGVA
jgi:anti-anti-sigma regulatory factor